MEANELRTRPIGPPIQNPDVAESENRWRDDSGACNAEDEETTQCSGTAPAVGPARTTDAEARLETREFLNARSEGEINWGFSRTWFLNPVKLQPGSWSG